MEWLQNAVKNERVGIMMQQLPKTLKEYYKQEGIDYEEEKDNCIE